MSLDDGILTIYSLSNTSRNGRKPVETLAYVDTAYYGERTIGYNRVYAAKAVSQRVDKLVRIWRNDNVLAGMYVILEDSNQYRVDMVQHLLDDDGLKITDLTLSRLEKNYELDTEA